MRLPAFFFGSTICPLMKQILATILLLISFTGCIAPNAAMKKFVGKPSADPQAAWGLPNEHDPDGRGGEIWSYYQQAEYTTPGHEQYAVAGAYNTSGQNATWMPSRTVVYTIVRSFYIDTNGLVYRCARREYGN
jgi:hypothetical protein